MSSIAPVQAQVLVALQVERPVIAVGGNSPARHSRVCVNYPASKWYEPLVMQANGKKKRINLKSGCVI